MCLIADTNNSRLVNRTNENWRLDAASSATSVRNMLANTPKLCPVRTSTRSNKNEPRNPTRKTKVSPIIVKSICLLLERGMHPKLLLPFMGNVGYFHRKGGFISLFQVSKESHLKREDILRVETVMWEMLFV
jgi:hypothetical protein